MAFRRAVMHAIDRDAAADSWAQRYGTTMQSYVAAFAPFVSTDAWDRYPYDPDTAQALYQIAVEETGRACSAVFTTTNNADERLRQARMYKEMMTDAGIPFELELRDSSIFFGEMLDAGTWDIEEWYRTDR